MARILLPRFPTDQPRHLRAADTLVLHPVAAAPEPARAAPEWSRLKLHRRFWADGDALELLLEVGGETASRAVAGRDGQFLFGPTGDRWARDLVSEAAAEWRQRGACA